MSKNKNRFLVIVAAVFVAFSVIAFAVPFEKNGMFWSAYIFSVIAIAAQIYAYPKAFAGESAKSKFYGFPIAKLTTVYLGIQLVLGLLFMAVAKWVPAWIGTVIFVLILCAAVVGFISADAMREEVERQDTVLKKNVYLMRGLQSKVRTLPDMCGDPGLRMLISDFAEEMNYCDPVSSDAIADIENELSANVDALQQAIVDGDNAAAFAMCKKCMATLTERNRLCKLNK